MEGRNINLERIRRVILYNYRESEYDRRNRGKNIKRIVVLFEIVKYFIKEIIYNV